MTADSKESVLHRWSRRKLEAREAREEETPNPAAEVPGESAAPAEAEDKPLLTDADMPPLDSLTGESDFSPFMSKGVSDELRNLALRKLFQSSVFNIRDGLDEYDDDFTTFEKLGDIVTADMKHQIEMQQQKLREKLAAEGRSDELAAADGEADMVAGADDDLAEDIDDDEVSAQAPSLASSADRDVPETASKNTPTRIVTETKS